MNDEFLHRLRKPPPPRFAAALKGRLDALNLGQQGWGWLRTLLLMFVAGGAAVATTLVVLRGAPTVVTQMFDPSSQSSPSIGASGEALSNSSEGARRMVPFSRGPAPAEAQPPAQVDVHRQLLTLTVPPEMLAPESPQDAAPAKRTGLASMPVPTSEPLSIVGSMSTYWLAQQVAVIAEQSRGQAALVARDDADGFRAFCSAERQPRMALVSQRMSGAQSQQCSSNRIESVIEMKIGRQAVVVSSLRGASMPKLSRRELYLALARMVPDPKSSGRLLDNPYRAWSQINPELPDIPIQVFGPVATTGLREPMDELVMEAGCNTYPWIKALKTTDEERYERVCHGVRIDGGYVEVQQNEMLIASALPGSTGSLALVSYPFYDTWRSQLSAVELEGIAPSAQSIESGHYPATRTLYIYVNRDAATRVPGFWSFLGSLMGEKGIGSEGAMVRSAGMIPLSDRERLALEAGNFQLPDKRF